MAGMLYLVATPIGNLEDITLRALRVLREVSLIACEDTRTSKALLVSYEIDTPLTSYHKFNEESKSGELVRRMCKGDSVALITDAGMPAISDPGETLVKASMEAGIPVTVIPGPSASVTALALSGADTRRFVFEGFLPGENRERREALDRLRDETRTILLYEAPHRLVRTLEVLKETLGGGRTLTLCRELTKRYEEIQRMTLDGALSLYREGGRTPRGEYVLVIDGKSPDALREEAKRSWERMALPEHVALYEAQGLARREAMKAAARDRGISRREVYRELMTKPDPDSPCGRDNPQ